MRRWKSVCRSIVSVDLELLHAVHTFQSAETLQRNFRCAGDELQELGSVCLIESSQCSPEPLNL